MVVWLLLEDDITLECQAEEIKTKCEKCPFAVNRRMPHLSNYHLSNNEEWNSPLSQSSR